MTRRTTSTSHRHRHPRHLTLSFTPIITPSITTQPVMADLTPPASQNNTPMRPLGPADEIEHPASPTPAASSALPRSTLNTSTAPTASALAIGTPEHDMDIDAELETHGQPPGYDTTADAGEAPPEYDIASDDEYSHSDISGDELVHEPLLSDEESDEGMGSEEDRHEEEGEAAPQLEGDAEGPPAALSGDEKGKGKLDVEEAGQQQTRPKKDTRSSRIRAGRQGPDVKEAKSTRVCGPVG